MFEMFSYNRALDIKDYIWFAFLIVQTVVDTRTSIKLCVNGLSYKTINTNYHYSKTCVKRPLKNRQNKYLNDKLLLNEGQKYCRMLHSAILLICIKL